jgi:HlyD family secretion protein
VDIARTGFVELRKKKRMALAAAAAVAVTIVVFALSRLEPAVPTVERTTLWTDTVKRGTMIRDVRGSGRLVPEEIRWIAASTEGRVEAVKVEPGATVTADTVILDLANPQQLQAALDAELSRRAAEADLLSLEARLESQQLEQRATLGRTRSEYEQARLRADADEELSRQGLVADINRRISQKSAEELEKRAAFEELRLEALRSSNAAQIAAQRAAVAQFAALERLKKSQADSLQVRAGIDGVLQQVSVEVGQQVAPGTSLAKVVRPEKLKAELRIAETQARDVTVGLEARIDTRNGIVRGRVSRVDPAAQAGTVTVDVALVEALPRGARPDLTVDGTIEIERLESVLHVSRPVHAEDGATISLFRVGADGAARRTSVAIGRTSVGSAEVVRGLDEGDVVVLSDMSAWDDEDRIRLR